LLSQTLFIPNDPITMQQWALETIQAFEAWDTTTGDGIIIAVVDTGVLPSHADLEGKILPGYNAILDNDRCDDDNGHGTAIAGLIAANANNATGIAGICWGCSILPVKALDGYGLGSDAYLARGIRWATDHGADIINLSMGGADNSPILREAIDYAVSRNVLVIAAAGNNHMAGNRQNYPAAFPNVLAVGATDQSDTITGFSTTGEYIDLVAPGVELWTTLLSEDYGKPDGTSFSSPFVAGVAGLVWTLRGDLDSSDVACILKASADDKGVPGKDSEYGWGRLNALRAVELAKTYTICPLDHSSPVPPPTAPTSAPRAETPADMPPQVPAEVPAEHPTLPGTPEQPDGKTPVPERWNRSQPHLAPPVIVKEGDHN
jgi:subtilisin family serine protease